GREALASVGFDRMAADRGQPALMPRPRHFLPLFLPGAALALAAAALPFLLKPLRILPKISGLAPWLRIMVYCCTKVITLLVIQYTTRPEAKPPSMNMKIQGIQAKTEA